MADSPVANGSVLPENPLFFRLASANPSDAYGDLGAKDQSPRAVRLTQQATAGYTPTLHTFLYGADGTEVPLWRILWDVPTMLRHPAVIIALKTYRSGIWPAEFEVKAGRYRRGPGGAADEPAEDVAEYVNDQLHRFWERSLERVQIKSYPWGWGGFEGVYSEEKGLLCWGDLLDFSPQDCRALVNDSHRFVGVRVKHVEGADGSAVDLPAAAPGRPGKGLWFAHRPQNSSRYGLTQCVGMWYPWRRLHGRGGAEMVLDGAFYRNGYQGAIVFYPPEGFSAQDMPPGASGSQNHSVRALQIGEQMKAGATVAIPAIYDAKGHKLYDLIYPQSSFDGQSILNYVKALSDQINLGAEVPPELGQVSQTGGYNGMNVPKEVFYIGQQSNATAVVTFCRTNWLDGLVWWNFGKDVWYDVRVKPLLRAQEMAASGTFGDEWEKMQSPNRDGIGGSVGGQDGGEGGGRAKTNLLPYVGPSGGRGKKNPQTGRVYYGMSLERLATVLPRLNPVARELLTRRLSPAA